MWFMLKLCGYVAVIGIILIVTVLVGGIFSSVHKNIKENKKLNK